MVFPVVIYRCESWTIKKAEHRRIDNFEPVHFSMPYSLSLDPHIGSQEVGLFTHLMQIIF